MNKRHKERAIEQVLNLAVGDRAKELRLAHGYDQSEIAKYLNVSQSVYCRMETGQASWSLYRAIRICELYDITVSDLVRKFWSRR